MVMDTTAVFVLFKNESNMTVVTVASTIFKCNQFTQSATNELAYHRLTGMNRIWDAVVKMPCRSRHEKYRRAFTIPSC